MSGLARPRWAIDPATAVAVAGDFISSTVKNADAGGVVIGLSGGIDSAVSAALAAAALGSDRVRGVYMPHRRSNPSSLADAREVAANIGVEAELRDISAMADSFIDELDAGAGIRAGNIMARCRMVTLYDISARDGSLVLGTGNRTEDLLGYTTMHGDNACALNPLGLLYKTEVRLIAAHMGLPAAVLEKAPSADLWEGQSDEDELGFTYAEADELLHQMIDEGVDESGLVGMGFASDLIVRIRTRVAAMAFKRNLPPVAAFPGRPSPDGR